MIQSKKNKLAEKMKPITQLNEQYAKTVKEITADRIKKVYKYLEDHNNPAVAFILESLVGFMRNQKANNESVEMYLRKYEVFMIGLNRLDIKKLNADTA